MMEAQRRCPCCRLGSALTMLLYPSKEEGGMIMQAAFRVPPQALAVLAASSPIEALSAAAVVAALTQILHVAQLTFFSERQAF